MSGIDWESIYSREFIFFEKCYETCDGYCCTSEFDVNFSKRKSIVLPLLESEYEYYKTKGGITNFKNDKVSKETFKIRDKTFTIYFVYCDCFGLCSPHCMRPLVCRLYPVFPLVDFEGKIQGFYPISFLDLFFSHKKAHKCTLVREHSSELDVQLRNSLQILLKYPMFIFLFKVMEILAKGLQDYMKSQCENIFVDLMSEEEKSVFLKKYNLAILLKAPWKNTEFSKQVLNIYDEIVKKYGEFL